MRTCATCASHTQAAIIAFTWLYRYGHLTVNHSQPKKYKINNTFKF